MRLFVPPLAVAAALLIPAVADASPFAVPLTANTLGAPPATAAPTMSDEAPAEDAPAEDTASEAAPTEDAPAEAPPAGDDEALADSVDPVAAAGEDDEDDDDFEDELGGPKKKGDFNANAFGLRGGIHLVPSYFLNAALASYSNSLCRDKVGGWGEKNGLTKVGGCNFYVGGDYIRRVSRAFDISVGLGYLHIKTPDSIWLDNDEWDRDRCSQDEGTGSNCNLGGADYTEIDLRMFTVEVNFIGRGTLYRNDDVELQMGGGGGVGLGVLIGEGVRRTPLGIEPSGYDSQTMTITDDSCRTLADTADFTKCTPRYYDDTGINQGAGSDDPSRDEVDMNGGMTAEGITSTGNSFARCSKDKCDGADLASFGATETGGTWPVYPLVNILGSFRVIIKDSFGIEIQGGIKNGFFFGGGIQYYFGGGGKDNK